MAKEKFVKISISFKLLWSRLQVSKIAPWGHDVLLNKSYIVLNFSCRKPNDDTLKNKNLTIKNIERNIELNKYIKKSKKLKKLNRYRHFCATIEQQG